MLYLQHIIYVLPFLQIIPTFCIAMEPENRDDGCAFQRNLIFASEYSWSTLKYLWSSKTASHIVIVTNSKNFKNISHFFFISKMLKISRTTTVNRIKQKSDSMM